MSVPNGKSKTKKFWHSAKKLQASVFSTDSEEKKIIKLLSEKYIFEFLASFTSDLKKKFRKNVRKRPKKNFFSDRILSVFRFFED